MTGADREAMRDLRAERLACEIVAFGPTSADISSLAGDIARALDRYADAVAAPLRKALALIAQAGGTTTDEGLSCNGSWCAEQARTALAEAQR